MATQACWCRWPSARLGPAPCRQTLWSPTRSPAPRSSTARAATTRSRPTARADNSPTEAPATTSSTHGGYAGNGPGSRFRRRHHPLPNRPRRTWPPSTAARATTRSSASRPAAREQAARWRRHHRDHGLVPSVAGGGFTVSGGTATDTIIGDSFADTIHGDAGRDYIDVLNGGADTVDCGSGSDVVRFDARYGRRRLRVLLGPSPALSTRSGMW